MKNQTFISFMALLVLASVSFIGCNNDGGGASSQDAQALTERDFFNNPNLSANPEGGVVVVFLEPTEALEVDNLTGGGLGFDVIPHRYTRTLNHTICWEDDNDDSKHFMILLNSDGEEVLRAQANGGCVTVLIEPGDYEMILTHGKHVDEIETVFLIPAPEGEQVTKRDEFNQKEIKTANGFSSKMHRYIPGGLVKFFESISNVFTRPARAQTGTGTPSANLTTLINTNECVLCNLMDVDLAGANLSGANLFKVDLSNAILTEAILTEAILTEAILTGTILTGAILTEAFLSEADLLGADLTGADLSEAFLTGAALFEAILTGANLNEANLTGAFLFEADLTGANLSEAILTGANLFEAILTGANLTEADLSFAKWIDGRTCDIFSLGNCNFFTGNPTPCASLTQSGNIIKCLLPSVDKEVCTGSPTPVGGQITDNVVTAAITCQPIATEDLVFSIDLVDVAQQVSFLFPLNLNTPMAIVAWGGEGGDGNDSTLHSGGDGGASGFASTVTSVSAYNLSAVGTSLFYYLALAGDSGDTTDCGGGGASTLVFSDAFIPEFLIAGGGGGGSAASLTSSGDNGGAGGQAIATINPPEGFTVGSGQNASGGAQGGNNGVGGSGGSSDADGNDGVGGEGGMAFQTCLACITSNAQWLNGDPGVGSNGRGGDSNASGGCAGGGGGLRWWWWCRCIYFCRSRSRCRRRQLCNRGVAGVCHSS